MAAGKAQEDGSYPEETVHFRVEQRLREMAKTAREFGRAQERGGDEDEKSDP